MKHFIACLLILFFSANIQAQKLHVVHEKESLYSIARLYSIAPKELAAYNQLAITAGLQIGQTLKIPASVSPAAPVPAVAQEPKTAVRDSQAIIHQVLKKENLFQIGRMYNVSINDIMKWNSLPSIQINEGASLIVGYKIVTTPVNTTISSTNQTTINTPAPAKTMPPPTKIDSTARNFNGGFFRDQFSSVRLIPPSEQKTGTAASFKSNSGWTDGKYYCLHNGAPVGTIIKLTAVETQRTVYLKVLDVIPNIKQNAGMLIRITDAAADELGLKSVQFEATIDY
ncbi:MAG: LysM peptidoglycan-binding domain-containing protein [Ferruginibacter sp.]